MDGWTIKPAPTAQDPRRHVLLLKGEMKDVTALLKKFGGLCGRPTPEKSAEGFNFSLFLYGLNEASMERVKAALSQLGGGGGDAAARAPEPSPPAPRPAEPEPSRKPAASPAQPLFGLPAPLDPALTLESLQVGAYNRFAHAAATAVIGAPGSMYNPLFLHGAPGVGKSHMAQAIAHGLGAALGKEGVILTSGPRLGRAASGALAARRFGEIEAALSRAKALVVDDLHLLPLTEPNTPALAGLFAMFFRLNLQVVLTSLYPPRALGALEEALKISFGKGWSVDLKVPNAGVQRQIIHSRLDRAGVTMTNEEVAIFLERLGSAYGEVSTWVRRLGILHRLSQRTARPALPEELMATLFNPDPPPAGQETPSAQQLESVKGFSPPAAGGDAIALALFVPVQHERLRNWVLARFQQAASQHDIWRGYRHLPLETYDAQQPFGAPFAIGEACQRSAAQAALIVGPPDDASLSARVGEFSHAVGHVLESLGARMAWMPYNGTMSMANFLRAHLDCLPDS